MTSSVCTLQYYKGTANSFRRTSLMAIRLESKNLSFGGFLFPRSSNLVRRYYSMYRHTQCGGWTVLLIGLSPSWEQLPDKVCWCSISKIHKRWGMVGGRGSMVSHKILQVWEFFVPLVVIYHQNLQGLKSGGKIVKKTLFQDLELLLVSLFFILISLKYSSRVNNIIYTRICSSSQ